MPIFIQLTNSESFKNTEVKTMGMFGKGLTFSQTTILDPTNLKKFADDNF